MSFYFNCYKILRVKRDANNAEVGVRQNEEMFRRKRSIGNAERSLRVNPDITPPPSPTLRANADETAPPPEPSVWQKSFDQELEDMGIKLDVEQTIEQVIFYIIISYIVC